MRVVLKWKDENGKTPVEEIYLEDQLVDPESPVRSRRRNPRVEITTQAEAEAWGKAIIQRFNDSRRDPCEKVRVLISAHILANV